MIPRLRPMIGWDDVLAAFRAEGTVDRFESDFATLMGQRGAVAFPYGRVGLMLLLEALGLKDREIILPAYTCVVVAHAIVLSGNRPVFVDSAEGEFNMDLVQAEAAISGQTGALIATSIHGYPVDLDQLDAIKVRHPGLIILQDCAHSFAAAWRGRPVQQAGTAALFGLNVSKLITSIFGGMVTTDDEALAGRLRRLRDMRLVPAGTTRNLTRATYLAAATAALSPPVFGIVDRVNRLGLLSRFTDYYDPAVIDMPADHLTAMCRAEAAVGIRQVRRYATIIAHRRGIAEVYDQALQGVPGLQRPQLVEGATYSHYVARVSHADWLVKAARGRGLELGRVIDYTIPDMAAYQPYRGAHSDFRVSRLISAEAVNLPLHVSKLQAERIAHTFKTLLAER